MSGHYWDVIAQNIKTGATRLLGQNKTEREADEIVKIAVMRRGVDEEFFKAVPAHRLSEHHASTNDAGVDHA